MNTLQVRYFQQILTWGMSFFHEQLINITRRYLLCSSWMSFSCRGRHSSPGSALSCGHSFAGSKLQFASVTYVSEQTLLCIPSDGIKLQSYSLNEARAMYIWTQNLPNIGLKGFSPIVHSLQSVYGYNKTTSGK